jgi:anaphase-promoting complex subunit 3
MLGSTGAAASVLHQLVDQHLNWCLFDSAQFYAERLYYEYPCPEAVYLLAQCFHRQGKLKQTYLLLHDCDIPQGRYLFAVVCIALKKYKEAEKALLRKNPIKMSDLGKVGVADSVPGGAAGLYLLGLICRVENRRDAAIAFYQASLQVSSI